MIDGLTALCKVISNHREEAEDAARLAPEVRRAAGQLGLWVLSAPKEVGGLELPLPDLLAVYEELGRADPTVGWHAVNSGPAGLVSTRLDPSVRARVFERTDLPFAYSGAAAGGALATPDGDGFRVSGTWPFMTGAADASWTVCVVVVAGPDGRPTQPPAVRRFYMPMADLEISETWRHASGMRGTGSHAVTAHSVFVPGDLAVPLDAPPLVDRPIARANPFVTFFAPCAAMSIGMLRSALDGVASFVSSKVSRLDGHPVYDDARVQQTVADALAAAECLSAGLAAVSSEYWALIESGSEPDVASKARLWAVVFATPDEVRRHVSNLYIVGTSATYATRNAIDRALRDVHALSAALETMQSVRRAAGAVTLGHRPSHPRF